MKTRLAFLCGGITPEDYLSRRSCQLLYQELDRTKFDIYILDWQKDGTVLESRINSPGNVKTIHKSILHCFMNFHGDIVVNLLHGEKENCGEIQGLLELAQIPYTGNGLSSSVVGMIKVLTKRCFKELGINTPADFLFQPRRKEDWDALLTEFRHSELEYPLILKPVKGGSSLGIQLVYNEKELIDFLEEQYETTPYIFEEFIQGDDFSVGVFATLSCSSPTILPVARMNYEGDFFDAKIKYDDTYSVEFPTDIKPDLVKAMQEAALKTHKCLEMRGFSRCDFIVRDDDFFALEINTHPGMSEFSIVPNMVKHAQLSLGSLFEQNIEEALDGV